MLRFCRQLSIPLFSAAVVGPLFGQGAGSPRSLSVAQTGCDTAQRVVPDSVYELDMVDQPVEPERLPIDDMPLRVREVLSGRSVFRFLVEPSGRIDLNADAGRCRRRSFQSSSTNAFKRSAASSHCAAI
jgi:hypothetical protein